MTKNLKYSPVTSGYVDSPDALMVTPEADIRPTPREARWQEVAQTTFRFCRQWFDDRGQWRNDGVAPDTRVTLWLCFGLLTGDKESVALANNILGFLEFHHHHPTRTPEEQASEFDIFVCNHSVQMLVAYGEKLRPDVRHKLEGWARHALKDYAGDRQSDYQFHGCNDNMPSKATLGMILGGEYFGDSAAVENGLWNLRQLRDMFTRRGLISEYTSPTYTPLTIINLTEIALLAKNAEACKLAAQCVERVWADVLGHFHSPTGTMGGPYARAYQLDSTGHFSTVACLLWIVLGERTSFDPVAEISLEPIRLVHHHDDRPSQLGILGWLSSCPVQPPEHLLQWTKNRKYPFRFKASAERGGDGAGEVNTTFYSEKDFAVGTAEGESWCELQSEMFFLQFRRHAPFRGIEDLRTAYCRYLVNDQHPGDRKADHCLKPHGIVHTVQEGRVALVLSRPSLSLAKANVQSLRFSFILPTHFGEIERIEVQDGSVFIEDGTIRLGLRGLNVTDWGRQAAVRIERVSHYQIISFYNYEGDARSFSEEELGRTLNGFVAVIGVKAEESRDAFRERVMAVEVLDYFHIGSRVVRCKVGGTILGMSYAVKTDRVRYSTINGRLAERPLWEADEMPAERLPFLNKAQPNSLELPYKHLRVVWAPNAPWVIGSTGYPPVAKST
ncbi:MAG: hypothetical protein ACFUZC_07905 [Chthoniobacteraceae bacterium]